MLRHNRPNLRRSENVEKETQSLENAKSPFNFEHTEWGSQDVWFCKVHTYMIENTKYYLRLFSKNIFSDGQSSTQPEKENDCRGIFLCRPTVWPA